MVKVGDTLPSATLQEGGDPFSKVDISSELKNGYLIGVPAAFSPACSQGHIPKYITQARNRKSGDIVVVAINDAFVMDAWHQSLDPQKDSGVRFLADTYGNFLQGLDLVNDDAGQTLGQQRGSRFALVIKDGKVEKVEVEPDWKQVTVSSADRIL